MKHLKTDTPYLGPAARAEPHTPEPWHVDRPTHPDVDAAIYRRHADGNPQWIGRVYTVDSPEQRDANAKRIVACVNACVGLVDPADAIGQARTSLHQMLAVFSDGQPVSDVDRVRIEREARAALGVIGGRP